MDSKPEVYFEASNPVKDGQSKFSLRNDGYSSIDVSIPGSKLLIPRVLGRGRGLDLVKGVVLRVAGKELARGERISEIGEGIVPLFDGLREAGREPNLKAASGRGWIRVDLGTLYPLADIGVVQLHSEEVLEVFLSWDAALEGLPEPELHVLAARSGSGGKFPGPFSPLEMRVWGPLDPSLACSSGKATLRGLGKCKKLGFAFFPEGFPKPERLSRGVVAGAEEALPHLSLWSRAWGGGFSGVPLDLEGAEELGWAGIGECGAPLILAFYERGDGPRGDKTWTRD